jgi:Kef-type K+ transport system membrane component KefB
MLCHDEETSSNLHLTEELISAKVTEPPGFVNDSSQEHLELSDIMSPFLQLALTLIIIVTGAKAGGWLANRFRQPAVLGELLAGVLLGPSLLNLLGWPILANPEAPHLLSETVYELAELGVICLMFLAGLEIDVGDMRRAGRVSTLAGVGGVIVPLFLGALVALPFGHVGSEAVFIGIILTATSVSISAQTLLELGVLRSRLGVSLLGAAVIDDVLVILLLSVFTAMVGEGSGAGMLLLVLGKMVLYLVLAALAGFLLLPRLAEWVHSQPISEGLAALTLVAALAFAWSAEVVGGLAAITGAFIAGLGFGRSRLRDDIYRHMHTITYAFLVPVFFVSIGLKTDARVLAGPDLLFTLSLLLVAVASKVLGSGLGARAGGFNNLGALRVGVGMISRGEVGLIVAGVGVASGIVEDKVFSVVTLIVLVTTLITPLMLRATFREKEASHA